MKNKKTEHCNWTGKLHTILQDFANEHNVTSTQMISFLNTVICGTMATQNYSEEFAKKTFERMFDYYLKKKKEFDESPKEYIFSSELRKRMSKFGSMPVEEALQCKSFWEELALYGGMSKEKIDEIMKGDGTTSEEKEKFNKMTSQEFNEYLEKMIEDALPNIIKAMENDTKS